MCVCRQSREDRYDYDMKLRNIGIGASCEIEAFGVRPRAAAGDSPHKREPQANFACGQTPGRVGLGRVVPAPVPIDACGGAQWSRAVFPVLPSSSVKQFRLYEITIIALLVLLAAYYRGETQIQGIVQTV